MIGCLLGPYCGTKQGPFGGPMGEGAVSHVRGTPVECTSSPSRWLLMIIGSSPSARIALNRIQPIQSLYARLIDFVHPSTLGWRVMNKKKRFREQTHLEGSDPFIVSTLMMHVGSTSSPSRWLLMMIGSSPSASIALKHVFWSTRGHITCNVTG
jgi:hypothetical protein